jgi:CRISPR/Cas system CSM-associated protein Csm3 (group 7 of RAMP superfamily)
VGTDLPLTRDGQGRLYVPGTGLAGVFREWCRAAFGKPHWDRLWGFQDPAAGPGDRAAGQASLIIVDDGLVSTPAVLVRDGVGLDREWGSAAPHVKYDRAILPPGAAITLEMTAELPDDESAVDLRAMVGHLLVALEAGEIRIGAGSTRGLGRVKLASPDVREQTFDRAGLLALVREGPRTAGQGRTPSELAESTTRDPARAPVIRIEVHWAPDGPLMVKAAAGGIGVDTLPSVEPLPDGLALVLPGSSVKGAFRTQAERIVRTVLPLPRDWEGRPSTERFLRQLDVPLVDWLFGSRARRARREEAQPDSRPGTPDAVGGILPGRGALRVEDCYATARLQPEQWSRIAAGADERQVRRALDDAGLPEWDPAQHVAIDRWTGGAARGRLFGVLEPHGVAWAPLKLDVALDRLPRALQLAALALLLLVLDDLAAGRLPLGYGTNRGFGAVTIEKITVEIPDGAGPGLPGPARLVLSGGVLKALDPTLRETLGGAWGDWIDKMAANPRAVELG